MTGICIFGKLGELFGGDHRERQGYHVVEETARVTRIRLDAVNAGNMKKGSPGRVD